MPTDSCQILYFGQDQKLHQQLLAGAAKDQLNIGIAPPQNEFVIDNAKESYLALIIEEESFLLNNKKILQLNATNPSLPLFIISRNDWSSQQFKELTQSLKEVYLIDKPLSDVQIAELFTFVRKLQELTKQEGLPKDYLHEIKESYKKSISDKINHFELLIDELIKTPSKESFSALAAEAHKIAGSAGSYGYPKVSILCRELENNLKEKLAAVECSTNDIPSILHDGLPIKLKKFLKYLKFYFQIH